MGIMIKPHIVGVYFSQESVEYNNTILPFPPLK
jgi:hypothetical protein